MPNWRGFKKLLFSKLRESRIPSISVAVGDSDGTLYKVSLGYKDVEKSTSPTVDTLYGIASITKTFTSIAILKLMEMGLLDIDDTVEEHLGIEFRVGDEDIRIWHLLTHSVGVPAIAYIENRIRSIAGVEKPLPLADEDAIVDFLLDATQEWVLARPGEKHLYLNEGYVLLGKVVEAVSGKDYYSFLRSHVLEPLRLYRTVLNWESAKELGDVATPYIVSGDEVVRVDNPPRFYSDAGLFSTVNDLLRFTRFIMNRGSLDGEEYLSPKYIDLMLGRRIRTRALEPLEYYGLGIGISKASDDLHLIGHSGSLLYYTSYTGFIPEADIAVSVLSNGAGVPMSRIALYALATAMEKPFEEIPLLQLDEMLSRLTGRYASFREGFHVEVSRKDDHLLLRYRGGGGWIEYPLIPREIGSGEAVFTVYSGGKLYEAVFRVRDGEVYLEVERYLFKRSGC